MVGWITLIIVVVILIALGPFVITQQQTAKVIERLGKFRRVAQPGLSFKIPLIDHVVKNLDLRVHSLEANLETKTKDNVFVNVLVATQFRIDPNEIKRAYYELSRPEAQIQSYIADAIRSSIPTMNLDDVFENKDAIALQVQKDVTEGMANFGFVIVKTLITSIDPAREVKESMNAINAAQRQRTAAKELAEAEKIQIVTKASAKAEESRLQGFGLAEQRKEIVNGLATSIDELGKFKIEESEIITLLMLTQYMDTLSRFAEKGNSTLMLPGTPNGVAELRNEVLTALVAGKKVNASNNKE